jgi:putative ABC transport system substrate-binding protein
LLLSRHTRRREFITLLGGAAAWPMTAQAQQAAIPVIGFLGRGSQEASASIVADFRKGLSETGYFDGQNVAIEYRWANTENERLPDLAADLVRRKVNVIVTQGSLAALTVKALTTTIPIVFSAAVDPVQAGLVASLNRPGGNVTGVSTMGYEIVPRQLGIVKDLLPHAERFGLLIDPISTMAEPLSANLREASAAIGRQIEVASAHNIREIDAAFTALVQKKVEAVIISPTLLFTTRRAQILTLAARHALPTVFFDREAVVAGGLMSYGPSGSEQTRQLGIFTGRILNGEKPSALPVLQPTKFSLVINLSTARALGLSVPPTLLAVADEVIE